MEALFLLVKNEKQPRKKGTEKNHKNNWKTMNQVANTYLLIIILNVNTTDAIIKRLGWLNGLKIKKTYLCTIYILPSRDLLQI